MGSPNLLEFLGVLAATASRVPEIKRQTLMGFEVFPFSGAATVPEQF
jgi:hypothetical protein